MNAVTSTALSKPAVPVMRITPPTRWWVVPFGELWDFRELVYFFVWRDVKIRYKQTAIGAAWAVLQPFLMMLIFSLFFAGALQNSTNTIVENQRLITKVYFPRLALPLSSVLSGLVDFGVSFLMFVVLMIYYHIQPTPALSWFPAFLVLAILLALGVGLWLSAMNAIYRDVRYVLPFLVQFWLFASPVVYPSSRVPERWRWLYGLNPMAGVIEGFRWSLTGRGNPPGHLLLISSAMVVVVLLSGVAYFQKMETTMADVA